jgi:tetratricopeptide (TPR) repeat protein
MRMTTQSPIDPRIAQEEAVRGQALLRAGKDLAALDAFQRAAWMAPDDPRIQWALANTLWRVGRGVEAVPVYERVIALLPDEPAPRCNLAELLAVLGCVDDARVQIAAAAAFAPADPHIYLAEAVVRLANHRPVAAEEAARQAITSGILPKFAHLNLGDALLAQGKTDEALAAYRTARQHCAPEDLRTMRQDLDWLGTVYPTLSKATHQQALAIFTAEGGRG